MNNLFYITAKDFSDFHELDNALFDRMYNTLFYKLDELRDVILYKELLNDVDNYIESYSDLEVNLRKYHDYNKAKSIKRMILEQAEDNASIILNCDHNYEPLAYVCAVSLQLYNVKYNMTNDFKDNVTDSRLNIVNNSISTLLAIMNVKTPRGISSNRYLSWKFENSNYH